MSSVFEEKFNEFVEKYDEGEEAEEKVEAKAEKEEVIERGYTLRKLKDGDLMPLLRILRNLGLKEFKDVVLMAANGKDVQEIGVSVLINIADKVIDNLDNQGVSEEIYSFYSGLSGLPVEEIKEMEFGTLPLMIYDSFSEVKNTSFFKVLAKFL